MDDRKETIKDVSKSGKFSWISDLNGEKLEQLEKELEDRKNLESKEDEN